MKKAMKFGLILSQLLMIASCSNIQEKIQPKEQEKEEQKEENKGQKNQPQEEIVGSLVYNSPVHNTAQNLDSDLVSRTGYLAIKDLSSKLSSSEKTNYVLSPASYLLAVSGLASVSEGFDNDAFGLSENAIDDVYELLDKWNFDDSSSYSVNTFKSAILHQQIGSKYEFDDEKRVEFGQKYVSTMVSDLSSYTSDAESFFKDKVGLNLPVPSGQFSNDGGVSTYSGMTIKDYDLENKYGETKRQFVLDDGTELELKSKSLGSYSEPRHSRYYKNDSYQVFKFTVHYTEMIVVLPNEGISINSIDVAEAYQNYINSENSVYYYGYIPFFHVKTEEEDITSVLTKKMTGSEKLYSKLLKDNVTNDLEVHDVLQSNDFEFDKQGITGESITVINGMTGSGEGSTKKEDEEDKHPIEINVNRSFYAISTNNDFPLFVSKVNDPSK